jgi:hypothetical protein
MVLKAGHPVANRSPQSIEVSASPFFALVVLNGFAMGAPAGAPDSTCESLKMQIKKINEYRLSW